MGYCLKFVCVVAVIYLNLFDESYGYSEGDLRLLGGYKRNEGTVLIYHNRKWGSICDSSWDIREARVVCRQLGYPGAQRAVGRSWYGRGRRMRWMSGLRCRGYETKLSTCYFPGWGSVHRLCRNPRRSAGVVCEGEPTYQPVYQPQQFRYTTRNRTTTTTTLTTTTMPTTTTKSTTTTTVPPTTVTPKATTPKPTTSTVQHKTLQQDSQYIHDEISFDDLPESLQIIPNAPTIQIKTPETTTAKPTTTTTTTEQTTTTPRPTTTTPKPTTITTTPKPTTTTTTTTTPKPTTTTTTTPKTTTTTTTPKPTTTTTTPKPTTTTTTTPKPTTTTTTTPKPTTTTTTTPKPTTTTTTLKPTTTSTTPRPPHPFVTTRRPQHRTTRRSPEPDRQVNVWFKDEILDMWALYLPTGSMLIAKAGQAPKTISEDEYRRKRGELLMHDMPLADDSGNRMNEIAIEEGNQIELSTGDSSTSQNNRNQSLTNNGNVNSIIPEGNLRHRHRHNHGYEQENTISVNKEFRFRLQSGRSRSSGRLEVMPPKKDRWGVICGDRWTFKEAIVACRHLGLGYAQQATRTSVHFGGRNLDKYFSTVKCSGKEQRLEDCRWEDHQGPVKCASSTSVAGIMCITVLPDLEPDIRMLETTAFLQDRPLYYLTCAMEEKCLSSSAYTIQRERRRGWSSTQRRLLRFSSVVHNKGTADFRPAATADQWEWHACHRHYHSMDVFAHYDVLDKHGNRVAEGLKASFCLEDSACSPGVFPKFECRYMGNQGISVGCSDNYMHDIDCQWIDITDLSRGQYVFKLEVNPHLLIPEISYDNNVITCDLYYGGYSAKIYNCKLGSIL